MNLLSLGILNLSWDVHNPAHTNRAAQAHKHDWIDTGSESSKHQYSARYRTTRVMCPSRLVSIRLSTGRMRTRYQSFHCISESDIPHISITYVLTDFYISIEHSIPPNFSSCS